MVNSPAQNRIDPSVPAHAPIATASGAVALGQSSTAVGAGGVIVGGDVGGHIITGSGNLILSAPGAGLQSQALQQSLQVLLTQSLQAAMRPQVEELFTIIRDPDQIPAAFFGPAYHSVAVRPDAIPYQPRPEAVRLSGSLLLLGRGGVGKTRAAVQLAQALCATGWTVCVARLDNCRKMDEPAGVLPDRKLLCVVDDLHRHSSVGGEGYLVRLAACLSLFQRDPDADLFLLATASTGDPTTKELEQTLSLSPALVPHPLSELPAETLQTILEEAARQAGLAIAGDESGKMVARSDRTPKTMVANVNRAATTGERLNLANWQDTWRGTWAQSFQQTRQRYPLADAVYEALHLLQAAGVPARSQYLAALATTRAAIEIPTGDGAIDGGATNGVARTLAALVQRGLLFSDAESFVPFVGEQIEASLQSVGKSLPHLTMHWEQVIAATTTLSAVPPAWLDDLVSLAGTLHSVERYTDVEQVATTVLVQDPGRVEANLQRGLARASLGAYRDAIVDFSAMIAGGYRVAKGHLLRGLSRFMLAEYTEAIADFTAAIAGGETLAYKGRGLAHIFRQEFEEAAADLTGALEANPGDGELFYLRGQAFYAQGAEVAALADFDRAITLGYDGPAAYYSRGWSYWQTGQLTIAEADFSHVLAEEESAFLTFLRAGARYLQGNMAGAEEDFTKAISCWEEDAYLAWLVKITSRLAQEQTDLPTLLAAHPEWIRELIQVIPGIDLPEEMAPEKLTGLADFWVEYMEKQLARQNIQFDALRQMESLPFLGRGMARLNLGKFAVAVDDFTAVLERGGDLATAYYGRGMARLSLGEIHAGVEDLTQSIAHNQEDNDTYYWRGRGHLALNDPAAAVADLTKAITLGRVDAQVYYWRGRAWLVGNDFPAAEADFSAAIEHGPADGATYFARGAVRHDLGHFAAAVSDFDRAEELSLEGPALYTLRGWAYFQQNLYYPAVADFTAALAIEPAAMIFYGRAAAHLNLGRTTEAEADYTEAIAHGMENGYAYMERGIARLEMGDLDGAVADADKALALGLADGQVYHVRGWARLRQAKMGLARDDLDKAIRLGFEDAVTYLGRGLAAEEEGDNAAAESDYSAVIARGLAGPAVFAARGRVRLSIADYAGAETDLDRAIAGGEDDGDVYAHRAQARANREDYSGAVADCTAALARGYNDEMTYLRGFASFQLKDYRPAVADFTTLISRGEAGGVVFRLRGSAHYLLGDYGPAESDATQAILADESVAFNWQLRALARVRLGQLPGAQQDCAQAGLLAADDPLTHDCRGDLSLARREYTQAIAAYETALERDPGASRHFALGLALLLAGRHAESAQQYVTGLEEAEQEEIGFAGRELDHWLAQQPDRVVIPEGQAALQELRGRLAAAGE